MSDTRHVSTLRRTSFRLTPLALALLLAACGTEAPGDGGNPGSPDAGSGNADAGDTGTVEPGTGNAVPGSNAVQAANSQTTSLRDAIALVAGDGLPVGTRPSAVPATGAARPAAPVAPVVPVAPVAPVRPATTPERPVNPLAVIPVEPVEPPVEPSVEIAAEASTETEPSEPARDVEPVAALVPESTPDVAVASEPEIEVAVEPEIEVDPEPEVEVAVEPEIEVDPEPEVEVAVEPEIEVDPEPEVEVAVEPEIEVDPEPEVEVAVEPEIEMEPAPAPDVETAAPADASGEPPRTFESPRTAGFRGEVLDDGSVRVSWPAREDARGYNVYRDSEFLTSVGTAEFIDEDIVDRDYYYEIQKYDFDSNLEFIATGLTVKVRGTNRPDPDAPVGNQALLDGYDLIFADEFDTGVLDGTKWNTAFLWGPDVTINSEEQYYVDALREPDFGYNPFTFEDGNLVINSIRTPDELLDKANGREYLSGMITSYDALKFTYGYAEVRARVPYGKGYWPAFWLLNAQYGGRDPEIDIMEFIGDNEDTVYHTYHYYDDDYVLRSTPSKPTKGQDFTADFHTYAADWRPGVIVFYIDGEEVHRVSDPEVSSQDMYVIANTAMGGWWAGPPDETTPLPGRYEIDYIRVYRQVAPYEMPPQFDQPSSLMPARNVPGASPGHRPPFELFPDIYPRL